MIKLLELFRKFFKSTKEVSPKDPPLPQKKPYKILLDLIAKHESPNGIYDVVYGGKSVGLTKMTISEVQNLQKNMLRRGSPSTAVGRYQFIRKTFNGLVRDLGVASSDIFDEELQDEFALELLKRRGYFDFINGKITKDQFMLNLSKEWASFPVPFKTKGHKRQVEKGETFYAGDGLNKALVDITTVANVLHEVRRKA